MYDTVAQYDQVVSNDVYDWHPPIMVRLWQLLQPLGTGTAPMFVLQSVLYSIGIALLAAALVSSGRRWAAAAVTVLALSPLLLGWQMVVLKDAQMLGAMLCAIGIVAHYRLQDRRVPIGWGCAATVLLAYATLVRANALFATVPLAVLLLPTRRRPILAAAVAVVGVAFVLAVTPIINHRFLRAAPGDVAKTQPLYDLAAIALMSPADTPFTPQQRAQIVARHCVKDFFWDALGEPGACGEATDPLMEMPAATLYLDLARAAALHPIAYGVHRLRHWNSTERWLVRPGLPESAPPIEAEPNELGLGTPQCPFADAWQDAAAIEAETPLGWPIVWTMVALAVLPAAWRRRREPAGGLALALATSAVTLELSFLVISISSDLRYHLWPMTASPLAAVLLLDGLKPGRRSWLAASAALALVIAPGLYTRATLPPAPGNYQAMIHAPSG